MRNEFLNERIDSLVSALLNEGYESRAGPGPVGVCDPDVLLPSLDGVFPMVNDAAVVGQTAVTAGAGVVERL